jgi:hypothetical protein
MGYTHGTEWTESLIKEKIKEVVDQLGLDRMPTRSECNRYFHGTGLANAISRRCGGWYALAKELGLEIKKSETTFGKTYEIRAAEMLASNGFQVRRMPQNFPYDLLIGDCVKVDVKAAKLYHGSNGDFYSFNLDKPFATCDFYLLMTVSQDGSVSRTMVVPSSKVISNNQISIGENKSKYHKFSERFDLIESAVNFWGNVLNCSSMHAI